MADKANLRKAWHCAGSPFQTEPLTQKSSDPNLLAVKVRMGLSGRGRFAGREKPETHTRSNSGIASVDHELGASDERGFLRYKE